MTREHQYRRYVRDTVNALDQLLTSNDLESKEETDRVLDEVNEVYEESELFKQIVKIMNNEFMDTQKQYTEIYIITKRYQDNLFNQL